MLYNAVLVRLREFEIALETNDLDLILRTCAGTRALACAPLSAVAAKLASGQLRRVALQSAPMVLPLSLATPADVYGGHTLERGWV